MKHHHQISHCHIESPDIAGVTLLFCVCAITKRELGYTARAHSAVDCSAWYVVGISSIPGHQLPQKSQLVNHVFCYNIMLHPYHSWLNDMSGKVLFCLLILFVSLLLLLHPQFRPIEY